MEIVYLDNSAYIFYRGKLSKGHVDYNNFYCISSILDDNKMV